VGRSRLCSGVRPESSIPSKDEPIGALAHIFIARGYAMQGDTAKAKAGYQDLLN
jgi:hypothetical protein